MFIELITSKDETCLVNVNRIRAVFKYKKGWTTLKYVDGDYLYIKESFKDVARKLIPLVEGTQIGDRVETFYVEQERKEKVLKGVQDCHGQS